MSRPAVEGAPGAWQRAADTSLVWQASVPVRRAWMGVEAFLRRRLAPLETDGADARTVNMVKASGLVRALDRVLATGLLVWRDSSVNGIVQTFESIVKERTVPGRIRLAGVLMAIASATALIVQRLAPRPVPFTWIVPALFLCVGLCLTAAHERRVR